MPRLPQENEIYLKKDSRCKLRRYIWLPKHPNGPSVIHARYIMEKKLGRYLKPTDIVHHIDNNQLNDKITNLRVFEQKSHHALCHAYNNSLTVYLSDDTEILKML